MGLKLSLEGGVPVGDPIRLIEELTELLERRGIMVTEIIFLRNGAVRVKVRPPTPPKPSPNQPVPVPPKLPGLLAPDRLPGVTENQQMTPPKRNHTSNVFVLYADKDLKMAKELVGHLDALVQDNTISLWYKERIMAGSEVQPAIAEHFESADLFLLLLTSRFKTGTECHTIGRQAVEQNKALVIPIKLEPVDLGGTPFAKLRPLPTDGRAVTSWSSRADAYLDIVGGIREALAHRDGDAGCENELGVG